MEKNKHALSQEWSGHKNLKTLKLKIKWRGTKPHKKKIPFGKYHRLFKMHYYKRHLLIGKL